MMLLRVMVLTKAPLVLQVMSSLSLVGAASSTSNRPCNVDTALRQGRRVFLFFGGGGFVCYDASRSLVLAL